jgi:peroxiredoxin
LSPKWDDRMSLVSVSADAKAATADQPTYTRDYDVPSPIMTPAVPDDALRTLRASSGDTLATLASRGPLLLVFLRHFGCPLCQEMVSDVAARRDRLVGGGTTVVFVHMHPEPQAAAFFARYGVQDLQRVSDPNRTLYRAFDVPQARPSSWLSLGTLRHYLSAIVRGGHRPWLVGGDVAQMSAVVRIVDGRIDRDLRGAGFDVRPDFDDLLACPVR